MSSPIKHEISYTPPAPGLPRPALPRQRYFWLGMALFTALLAQQLGAWRWPWLTALQLDSVYKQATGFTLLAFILYQWRFSLLRSQGDTRKAAALARRHKAFGAMAPLLLFVHSQSLGYAYLQLLSLSFLLVFLTGLLNFETTRIRRPWFMPVWVTVHVSASMALLFLLTYHIYIGYAFK